MRSSTGWGVTGSAEGLRSAWPRLSRLLTGEHLAELGVVEPKPFRAALEAIRAGYAGPNMQFSNTALYLETWLALKAHSSDEGVRQLELVSVSDS